MPNFQGVINNFIAGDDLEVKRTITNLPLGLTLTDAWMTIKSSVGDSDQMALVQKHATTVFSATQGHISDPGTDGTAEVRFFILPTDSDKLGGPVSVTTGFVYDIQVRTADGKVYTPEKGTITAESQVTRAVI